MNWEPWVGRTLTLNSVFEKTGDEVQLYILTDRTIRSSLKLFDQKQFLY